MSPEGTRVWRKTRRQALRGVPTGRRSTHAAVTTPPRIQDPEVAAAIAKFNASILAMRKRAVA
jgi:hypothetical protein